MALKLRLAVFDVVNVRLTFKKLVELVGSVPAVYSCQLVKPSPSKSRLRSEALLVPNPYCASQTSGMPSRSVSPRVVMVKLATTVPARLVIKRRIGELLTSVVGATKVKKFVRS